MTFSKYSIACGAGKSKIIDFNKSDINFYLDDKYKIKLIKNGYGIRNLSGIFLFLLKIIF